MDLKVKRAFKKLVEVDTDISIKADLWKDYFFGYLTEFSGVLNHNFMSGINEPNVQTDARIYSGDNYISLDIETIGISRINTLAVYEEGGFSLEYGRYPTTERMTVVMLNINDIGEYDYFDEGINAIVIPTSIFTNTKLHAIIETSVDENGLIQNDEWESITGAEIAGIDRDLYKDSISPNVECVITKDVTGFDANDILINLILTSADPDEGRIYEYYQTYQAETLGIAADILQLIPLDMEGFVNSPVGEWPRTPWENFVQLVVDFINFIIDVLIAIGTFFADLIGFIAEQGMNLVAGNDGRVSFEVDLNKDYLREFATIFGSVEDKIH